MRRRSNPWKGFVLGMFGGLAGLAAMRYYWKNVAPLLDEMEVVSDQIPIESQGQGELATRYRDISIYGRHFREDETASGALGRLIYQRLKGEEPRSQEGKEIISGLTLGAYAMLNGGMYGALRRKGPVLDTEGGLAYGAWTWLLSDEIAVPLMGLKPGPAEFSPRQHVKRLGAYLSYGLATALTTQALHRLF